MASYVDYTEERKKVQDMLKGKIAEAKQNFTQPTSNTFIGPAPTIAGLVSQVKDKTQTINIHRVYHVNMIDAFMGGVIFLSGLCFGFALASGHWLK